MLALDGGRLLRRDAETIRNRNRIVWNGVMFVTVVLNQFGEMVNEPMITAPSLFDEPDDDARLDHFAAESEIVSISLMMKKCWTMPP